MYSIQSEMSMGILGVFEACVKVTKNKDYLKEIFPINSTFKYIFSKYNQINTLLDIS